MSQTDSADPAFDPATIQMVLKRIERRHDGIRKHPGA